MRKARADAGHENRHRRQHGHDGVYDGQRLPIRPLENEGKFTVICWHHLIFIGGLGLPFVFSLNLMT
jgi:hypothetical protein